MNYSEMSKKELIAECERLNLKTKGTKSDLEERLDSDFWSKNECEYELIDFGQDPTMPIPKGLDIFYRCTSCSTLVPSCPTADFVKCDCKYFNIAVDVMDFKIWIVDYDKVEFLRKVLKKGTQ